MANDVLQFVDSIAIAPTVRLDLNDGTKWEAEYDGFDFSPPPLRRAINGTLLTDGSVVSASSYDNRTLLMTLSIIDASVDAVATQIQLLNRELDRDGNYIKWQPNTATSPVFFKTLRSTATRITEVPGNGTFKTFDVSVLAEPFALGLREDISQGTFNNDPAAGAQGLFFDVTGAKGDVPAPLVIRDSQASRSFGMLASRSRGTPSNLVFFAQAEGGALATDTTNPGGGPDAAMSGTGTNNFVRTTFATDPTMVVRWTAFVGLTTNQLLALPGTYRVIACVRRSDTTSAIKIQGISIENTNQVAGPAVTVPATTTSRQIVDLGLFTFGGPTTTPGRYGLDAPVTTGWDLALLAQRVSGAGTLDWDYVMLVPADEQLLLWDSVITADNAGRGSIVDGYNETVYSTDGAGGGLFLGATPIGDWAVRCSGGFPMVKPNQTNRFFLLYATSPSAGAAAPALVHAKATTGLLFLSYWPRYLYARPATT